MESFTLPRVRDLHSVFFGFMSARDCDDALQRLKWYCAIKRLKVYVLTSSRDEQEFAVVFDNSVPGVHLGRLWELAKPGELSVPDDDTTVEEEVKDLYLQFGGFMGWVDYPPIARALDRSPG